MVQTQIVSIECEGYARTADVAGHFLHHAHEAVEDFNVLIAFPVYHGAFTDLDVVD